MLLFPTVDEPFPAINETNVIKAIYNLRHELARQLWAARHGECDGVETSDNTRTLVTLCHHTIMDRADKLQHAVCIQISITHNRQKLIRRGENVDDIRPHAIRTRDYLPAIKINK